MKVETKILLVYIVVGIIVGFLSNLGRNLYGEVGNYIAIVLALLFLVISTEINKKLFKVDKDFKWFLSNGGWIYLFVWFISWIIFFNPPLGVL
ncbi:hypothetical protein A3K64_01010 [Candidatus Micrarchaeota archaeon RBG_16_36_9]|nr:MAG: hypothetical protein A3K64_01010 [Candidatus Micrarchaeota archaeon RBG_16_36_9]